MAGGVPQHHLGAIVIPTLQVLGQALSRHKGPFLDHKSGSYTFEEVGVEAARIGSWLASRNIARGDAVAVAMTNEAPVGIVWFGLLRAGVSIVPLNPVLPDEEITYILRMSEAKLIISDSAIMPKAARWSEEAGSRTDAISADDKPWKEYSEAPEIYVDPEDIAVIFFTSGTTGRPKGAMLSHRALIANARGCEHSYWLDSEAAFACPIPIFHAFAATVCLFLPALIGGRTYLHSPLDPKGFIAALATLESRRILVAVPSLLEAMAFLAEGSIENIAFIVSGGAALPSALREKIAALSGQMIYEGYGTTECGPVITSQTPGRKNTGGSVGPPISGVDIDLRSSDGNDVMPGEIGEIVVRTPGLMSGYYDLATATKASIKGGWFHTGDLGYLSEDGELFIVDRISDAITVKGITVLPQQIESVLNAFPAVFESAVVGVPDGTGGEAPWAFVRPRPGLEKLPDASEIIRFCRDRLPIFAVPRGVEYRDSLPKTITGKILKRTLRQKWL